MNSKVTMEWEINIQNEDKYIEVTTKGVADFEGSLNMAKYITEIMTQNRIKRVLIDHRNITAIYGKVTEIYERPKNLRIIGLILGVKIAIFHDRPEAMNWLLR